MVLMLYRTSDYKGHA